MSKFILIILVMCLTPVAFSQKIFSEKEFISVIRQFHPAAKQAELGIKYAEADVISKRAGFDPEFVYENAGKELEGVSYYTNNSSQVRIPSWYGIDFIAGKESITGDRVNPESTNGSLTYLGISVPLLKNLVMDKRRAELQQAKQFVLRSGLDQALILNNLLKDGLHTYWKWWESYRTLELVTASKAIAERRLQMVKTFVISGERAAIDTVEAVAQVQYFQQKQSEAEMDFQKAGIELSLYLWKEGNEPYELPAGVTPQPNSDVIEIALEEALVQSDQHPEIKAYEVDLNSLDIEKRLKFQSLLPSLNFKYNQLGKEKSFQRTLHTNFMENNFQYGISLSVPLRLSEGRGEYKKARIKIDQTRLKQVNKRLEIKNKVKQCFTEFNFTNDQVQIQQNYAGNILKLQQGEEQKFLNGESSLFLINAREQKTLESKEKLIQLEGKAMKTAVNYKWSIGNLNY